MDAPALSFLFNDFLGQPTWMWAVFLTLVAGVLALDLGVLHKDQKEIGVGESMVLSTFYFALAVAFGGWIWWTMGPQAGLEYYTGFMVEWSLSLDNVFAISMIFGYFAVPRRYQHRGRWLRFPPTVPALRICGVPTSPAAATTAG